MHIHRCIREADLVLHVWEMQNLENILDWRYACADYLVDYMPRAGDCSHLPSSAFARECWAALIPAWRPPRFATVDSSGLDLHCANHAAECVIPKYNVLPSEICTTNNLSIHGLYLSMNA
jgi:hypothetical protein